MHPKGALFLPIPPIPHFSFSLLPYVLLTFILIYFPMKPETAFGSAFAINETNRSGEEGSLPWEEGLMMDLERLVGHCH